MIKEIERFDAMLLRKAYNFIASLDYNHSGFLCLTPLVSSKAPSCNENSLFDSSRKAAGEKLEPLYFSGGVICFVVFGLDTDAGIFIERVADSITNEVETSLIFLVYSLMIPSVVRIPLL